MDMNIQAMLQTSIAVGLLSLIGVWGVYAWLKYSNKKDRESMRPN